VANHAELQTDLAVAAILRDREPGDGECYQGCRWRTESSCPRIEARKPFELTAQNREVLMLTNLLAERERTAIRQWRPGCDAGANAQHHPIDMAVTEAMARGNPQSCCFAEAELLNQQCPLLCQPS